LVTHLVQSRTPSIRRPVPSLTFRLHRWQVIGRIPRFSCRDRPLMDFPPITRLSVWVVVAGG
jgi:hypothetical protein